MALTRTRLPLLTRLDKEGAFLASSGHGLRLSLYLPFDKTWREPLEDKVLLRDLRRDALRALEAREAPAAAREALLAPIDALLSEPDTTRMAGDGLALFADEARAVAVLLPKAPAAGAFVDARFKLDGVLSQLAGRDRYYLLSLSQHAVRLWDCDGVAMREIELDGMDVDIRGTRHHEPASRQTSMHAGGSGHHGLSKSDSIHSGAGAGDGKEAKKDIEHFLRQIDHGIHARMAGTGRPLVLAGVGYLLPIYRKVNTYPHLLEAELPGSPDSLGPPADLHLRANAVLDDRERMERNHAVGSYLENLSRARSCAGFTDVVPCAFQRRLTHLFLESGRAQWGAFDPATGETRLVPSWRPGAEDLVNLAAVHAYLGQARIYAFAPGELPHGVGIAGLFRG